ncbi:MAG: acetyl-coenzyme A synthetase, partial [Actinobacteria bacterium]|nr:acetyl-coenzyme A synthetase [Actinomycetota bacterium]
MVDLYELADNDRLGFWAEQAKKLHWHKPFTQTLDFSEAPFAKWFADGQLNASYNCLDRHVLAGRGDRTALLFEGEPGDTVQFSYAELLAQTKKAANALLSLGVQSGDRVAIYAPLIPETIIAMLAVARIGAVHSVVFGGFSAEALRNRILDAGAKIVITADGGYRKGKVHELKSAVDLALAENSCPTVEKTIVIQRTKSEVTMTENDLWWHELISAAEPEHEAVAFDAEHPLFILYTSGTTGKP